jgi:methylthioribose-1-phosphate isomerase
LIADEDAEHCRMIGQHGLQLIRQIAKTKRNKPVNVLTHCNAGWLAFVDYGSATAPIYAAHDSGLPLHVWVTETRPRNQGSKLTAWELGQHGVPHTVIADSAAGHLMQRGEVDLVIVGTDRTTYTGMWQTRSVHI